MPHENVDFTETPPAKRARSQDRLPEDQAISDCLGNPVIVRKILENFNVFELIRLSVVNKLWNYEARSLIRKEDKIVARFPDNNKSCKDVTAFLSALENMKVVPYSGLRIYLNGRPTHRDVFPPLPLLDPPHLDRLFLNNFTVQLRGKSELDKDSPFLLLIKKSLESVGGALEKLTLCVPFRHEEFTEKVVQVCSFPRLKTLKLEIGVRSRFLIDIEDEAFTDYVKALLSRAPVLQELQSEWPLDLTGNILEGSSAKLVYKYDLTAPFDEIPENVNEKLQLERMRLVYDGPEFDLERFNRITPKLLRTCCTETLRSISMDEFLAVSFMCFGIQLEGVQDFELAINYTELELDEPPRLMRIVKGFDFTRLLPKVMKAKIFENYHPEISPEHLNVITEQADAVLAEPMPDRAVNIKHLELHNYYLSNETIQLLAQMFPSIQQLYVPNGKETVFRNILENWTGLKGLEVFVQCSDAVSLNLDSAFCGIFPDEVAQLREKDEEYLKTVHIVPVMPAITCLKSLTSLTLSYGARYVEPILDYFFDRTFIFSKVTGLVAFGRCPHLRVTIKGDSRHARGSVYNRWNEPLEALRNFSLVSDVVSM